MDSPTGPTEGAAPGTPEVPSTEQRPRGADPLAQALGRIPSGLFVVTAGGPGETSGFVASFVQQVGFTPPTVMVAIGAGREHLALIRATGRFAISVLGEGNRTLLKAFFGAADGREGLARVATLVTPNGATVLTGALAWLDCRLASETTVGDHTVIFGTVEAGERTGEGGPLVHVRRNGLTY